MLIIGIADVGLSDEELNWIAQPQVSGVILFKRNFISRPQVTALIESMRMLRGDEFLICVDQEGGPVQRFREGFTQLPALGRIGALYDRDPHAALALAEEHAWLMASEMRAIDIDLSFAPVLDLARGNRAIGERSLHASPQVVSELGLAYLRGMRLAGMAATLKHFPGHGSVVEDTHFDAAADLRSRAHITATDLLPFADAIAAGAESVMMAHVAYPAVDVKPAGYSIVWINEILRGELGFGGTIFSDDVSMLAAASAGDIGARIDAHIDAGCDLVLVCRPEVVAASLAATSGRTPYDPQRVARLRGTIGSTWQALADNPQRDRFIGRLTALA